jgi:nucleotide-binding universal stress UspA family protein
VLRTCDTPVLILNDKSRLFPVNRILLTTDFSDNSVYAFQPAADLAELTGAQIDLIHVVSHEPLISKDKSQYSGADIASKLENMADSYLGDLRTQVHTDWRSCKRSVHEEIASIANTGDYQLVVMATIGRTGLKYLMLGSTSSSVLRHANIPVLSVKPRNRAE